MLRFPALVLNISGFAKGLQALTISGFALGLPALIMFY
jgi:hypothetical protein